MMQAELEEYAKKGEKPPDELTVEAVIPERQRPAFWPTNWPQVAERLRAQPETVARAKDVDPLFTETLSQLMFALRLFSFTGQKS
jgi:hypothetical protein